MTGSPPRAHRGRKDIALAWGAWSCLAMAGGLGLAELARGISTLNPPMAWPTEVQVWLGVPFGLLAAVLIAGALRWGFDLAWSQVRLATALACLPGLVGWGWPLFARLHLPPPHDLPQRPLQIFLAGLCLLGLALLIAITVRQLHRRGDAMSRPRWTAWRLLGLAWLSFMITGAWTSQWTTTGDTPHYLLMTQALSERFSGDLRPDYEDRSYLRFFDGPVLERQLPSRLGRDYSHHRPGLVLAVIPGWKLLGPWGARWLHAGLAAAACTLFFWVLVSTGHGPRALLAWGLLAFSSPWIVHAPGMMPEILPGLLWLLVLAAWRKVVPPWMAFVASGAMVWMNLRLYPLAAILALQCAWSFPTWRWRGLATAALMALGAQALQAYQFGSWHPMAAYHHNASSAAELFLWSKLPAAGFGLFIDQEYGLLTWAPAFLIAVAGLRRAWQRNRPLALQAALGLLVYFLPLTTVLWWHGVMAPSRYMVPALPLLALWAAEALDWQRWGQRCLLSLTWCLGLIMAVLPWLCYSKQQGQNLILRLVGERAGLDLTSLFPSYIVTSAGSWVWAALFLVLTAWSMRRWSGLSRAQA